MWARSCASSTVSTSACWLASPIKFSLAGLPPKSSRAKPRPRPALHRDQCKDAAMVQMHVLTTPFVFVGHWQAYPTPIACGDVKGPTQIVLLFTQDTNKPTEPLPLMFHKLQVETAEDPWEGESSCWCIRLGWMRTKTCGQGLELQCFQDSLWAVTEAQVCIHEVAARIAQSAAQAHAARHGVSHRQSHLRCHNIPARAWNLRRPRASHFWCQRGACHGISQRRSLLAHRIVRRTERLQRQARVAIGRQLAERPRAGWPVRWWRWRWWRRGVPGPPRSRAVAHVRWPVGRRTCIHRTNDAIVLRPDKCAMPRNKCLKDCRSRASSQECDCLSMEHILCPRNDGYMSQKVWIRTPILHDQYFSEWEYNNAGRQGVCIGTRANHPTAAGRSNPEVRSRAVGVRSRAVRTGPLHFAAGDAHVMLPVAHNSQC